MELAALKVWTVHLCNDRSACRARMLSLPSNSRLRDNSSRPRVAKNYEIMFGSFPDHQPRLAYRAPHNCAAALEPLLITG
jgi:hypothetical protein